MERRRVDDAIGALHAVIRDIRNFIFGLRPVLLETGTLTDGLEHLAAELHRNGGVRVEVSAAAPDGVVAALPIELVAELLAVAREALSNIARHATATEASVRLSAGDDELTLELADNGRGFRPGDAPERGHNGLANIRARTEGLGGRFEMTSAPGSGTRMIITVPIGTSPSHGDQQ